MFSKMMYREQVNNNAIENPSNNLGFQRNHVLQPNRMHSLMIPSLLEPTPIDTGRIIPVVSAPSFQPAWNGDDRFLAVLQGILSQTQGPQLHMNSTASSSVSSSVPSFPVSKAQSFPVSKAQSKPMVSRSNAALQQSSLTDHMAEPTLTRCTQLEQWNLKYQELNEFKNEHKHCSVPLHYAKNPSLAHWVKRQRHQYRMKMEGKHSTLTDDREAVLDKFGFVWYSHAAAWDERWNQLREFRDNFGHSRVPKNFPINQQLGLWVKCQRRQFKLYSQGKPSNMSKERIEKLRHLDFVFDPRSSGRMY